MASESHSEFAESDVGDPSRRRSRARADERRDHPYSSLSPRQRERRRSSIGPSARCRTRRPVRRCESVRYKEINGSRMSVRELFEREECDRSKASEEQLRSAQIQRYADESSEELHSVHSSESPRAHSKRLKRSPGTRLTHGRDVDELGSYSQRDSGVFSRLQTAESSLASVPVSSRARQSTRASERSKAKAVSRPARCVRTTRCSDDEMRNLSSVEGTLAQTRTDEDHAASPTAKKSAASQCSDKETREKTVQAKSRHDVSRKRCSLSDGSKNNRSPHTGEGHGKSPTRSERQRSPDNGGSRKSSQRRVESQTERGASGGSRSTHREDGRSPHRGGSGSKSPNRRESLRKSRRRESYGSSSERDGSHSRSPKRRSPKRDRSRRKSSKHGVSDTTSAGRRASQSRSAQRGERWKRSLHRGESQRAPKLRDGRHSRSPQHRNASSGRRRRAPEPDDSARARTQSDQGDSEYHSDSEVVQGRAHRLSREQSVSRGSDSAEYSHSKDDPLSDTAKETMTRKHRRSQKSQGPLVSFAPQRSVPSLLRRFSKEPLGRLSSLGEIDGDTPTVGRQESAKPDPPPQPLPPLNFEDTTKIVPKFGRSTTLQDTALKRGKKAT